MSLRIWENLQTSVVCSKRTLMGKKIPAHGKMRSLRSLRLMPSSRSRMGMRQATAIGVDEMEE